VFGWLVSVEWSMKNCELEMKPPLYHIENHWESRKIQ